MLACLQQGFSTITVRAARLLNGGASCGDGVVVMTRARVLAVGVVLAATLVSTGGLASAGAPRPPANFLQNARAEASPGGTGQTVNTPGWLGSVGKSFTAVKYGAPGFPSLTSPGPNNRGKNFFAGGS